MSKKKFLIANNPLLSGPAFDERERSGVPYRQLQISVIDRDPNQPRVNFDEGKLQELSSSIKTYGILSPLLVRPSKVPGRYTLIAGERRFRAAQLAKLEVVPVLIDQQEDSIGDRTLAMQLVENLQRSDLSSLERAHAIGALKDAHNLSVRDIADKLGISKSMVQRSLDILELPDDLLSALREGASESKILLLAKIADESVRATYLKDIELLTRRELEANIVQKPANSEDVALHRSSSPEDLRIADEIQRALGLKVKLSRSLSDPERGKLVIEFYSNDDLQEVFRKLIAEAI